MSGSKIIKREQVDQNVSLGSRLDINEAGSIVIDTGNKIVRGSDAEHVDEVNDILAKARVEAEQIKKRAKELYLQVEDKTEKAKQDGFERGRAEGLAEVTARLVQIEKKNQEMLRHIEKESLALVYEIAQKLIGDALKNSDEAIVGMVRQALQSSMGNELTLFVNPEDFERIKAHEATLMSTLHSIQTLNIKPSERVKIGGCLIESELGSIDAQIDLQLAAIRKALGLDGEGA